MNSVDLIVVMPPGAALLALNDATGTTDFLLREDEAGMRGYPAEAVPCRSHLMAEAIDGVLVIALYARLGPRKSQTFETFINVYNHDGGGREMLDRLILQDIFQVSFFVHGKAPARQIGFRNRIQDAFRRLRDQAATMSPWTMRQFDEAKAEFQRRHSLDEISRMIDRS